MFRRFIRSFDSAFQIPAKGADVDATGNIKLLICSVDGNGRIVTQGYIIYLYNKAASSFSPFSSAPLTAFPRAFPVASFQGLAAERHYVPCSTLTNRGSFPRHVP